MSAMTLDDYLKEKRTQVFAHAQTETRLSGLCCLRCCHPLLVGATFCSACHHQFQWPCPAKENVPRNPQGEMQLQVVRQVFQDFRYAPLANVTPPMGPHPLMEEYLSITAKINRSRRWVVWAAISGIGVYVALMAGYVMNLTAGRSNTSPRPSMTVPVSRQPGTPGYIPASNP